jgi:membrane associated rhomboid family serine protease
MARRRLFINASMWQAFRVFLWLVLLPFWVTTRHLVMSLQNAGVVVVSRPSIAMLQQNSSSILPTQSQPILLSQLVSESVMEQELFGMYKSVLAQDMFQHIPLRSTSSWPSIAQIGATIQQATSNEGDSQDSRVISWKDDRWCLQVLCSAPILVPVPKNTPPPPPQTGVWSDETGKARAKVLHFGTASYTSNQNLRFVLRKPTTTLLLIILVGLAFYYWNYTIDPSVVSKSYSRIVHHHEYYRAFTGATAHFEPIHLGFNCMALYSLGIQLEDQLGSIPFLLYNISLIPITSLIMMLLIRWQVKRTDHQHLMDQSAVGYSGVLFAWMVVATLNSDMPSCPIPLFHNVCFHTYTILGVKANLGPVVQLVVAQVVLPRASLMGHLAGIIAGFAMHWNLLPITVVQPAILIPGLLILLLPKERHEGSARTAATVTTTSNLTLCTILSRLWIAGPILRVCRLMIIAFWGLWIRLHWTLLLTLILQAISVYYCHIVDTIAWRKTVMLSLILGVITDSMTLAGWLVLGDLYNNGASTNGATSTAVAYMVARLFWQVMYLNDACLTWMKTGDCESGGPFAAVFGRTILGRATLVGAHALDWAEHQPMTLSCPSNSLV